MTKRHPPRHGDKPKPESRPIAGLLLIAVLAVVATTWLQAVLAAKGTEVKYTTFYELVQSGAVAHVVLDGQSVEAELAGKRVVEGVERTRFRTIVPTDDESLLPLLRGAHVKITAVRTGPSWGVSLLATALPLLMFVGLMLAVRRPASLIGNGRLDAFVHGHSHRFDKSSKVAVSFDDVAGLAAAKRDLREIVEFLKDPKSFARLGARVPRGVLLVGPPGTGKTLLARAVAGESKVPFFSIAASEFVEMFVGVGAARVRDLFDEARKESPSILFIDEIDAVGRARGAGLGGGHDEREQTLNQLLSEMDGFSQDSATIVLAATNRPDVLDPALLRPGRFDRRVVLDRPELDARRSILAVHVKRTPLAADVNLDSLARGTVGFTGADLSNLVNEAALFATHRGAEAVAERDFAAALDKLVLGDPREARLDSAEKKRVAIHESGHTVVAHFLPHAEPIHRVSVIPRGMSLGATQQLPLSDRHLLTRSELDARLTVLMGGRAAELLLLGEDSTGAENDLKTATKLAMDMVAHYGMSDALGPVYCEHQTEHPFLGQRLATDGSASDATIAMLEKEAGVLLSRAHSAAIELLGERHKEVTRLVQALVDSETVEEEKLAELLDGTEPEVVREELAGGSAFA